MLKMFITKSIYRAAVVHIYVDCEAKETSVTVTYAGRLLHDGEANADVAYADAQTPAQAEAWLGGQVPYRDGTLSRLEHIEALFSDRHREAQVMDLLHTARGRPN